MRAIVMRVKKGEVFLKDVLFSSIGHGAAVFVGFKNDDDESILEKMAEKISNLRIFEDDSGKLNYSLKDKGLEILCVPNFTLYANTDSGRRPSFESVMPKETAAKLFENFTLLLKARNLEVKTGSFGEYMDIHLEVDGPVNIILQQDYTD